MMILIFPVLGAVCLWCFLKNRIKKASAQSLIWKTCASICFLGTAFIGLWRNSLSGGRTEYSLLITAGLFFGLLGDIWLDLKWNCPDENDRYTFAGFWSFAIGHICFLTALIRYSGANAKTTSIIVLLMVAAVAGVVIGFSGRLLSLDYGRFKGITMFYGALLIGTTLVSGRLMIQSRFSPFLVLFFAGAVLFLISDLILSGTYFGKGKDRPVDIISNHIFYYAAQFLIAFAVSAAV